MVIISRISIISRGGSESVIMSWHNAKVPLSDTHKNMCVVWKTNIHAVRATTCFQTFCRRIATMVNGIRDVAWAAPLRVSCPDIFQWVQHDWCWSFCKVVFQACRGQFMQQFGFSLFFVSTWGPKHVDGQVQFLLLASPMLSVSYSTRCSKYKSYMWNRSFLQPGRIIDKGIFLN